MSVEIYINNLYREPGYRWLRRFSPESAEYAIAQLRAGERYSDVLRRCYGWRQDMLDEQRGFDHEMARFDADHGRC